jgi:hypothetical protein
MQLVITDIETKTEDILGNINTLKKMIQPNILGSGKL